MKHKIFILACLFSLFPAGGSFAEGEASSILAEAEVKTPPPYGSFILANALFPGTAQFMSGKTLEASFYSASTPLQLSGLGIILYYYFYLNAGVDFPGLLSGSASYPFTVTENDPSIDWVLLAGTAMSAYGALLGAYSGWAAHRDYIDEYGATLGIETRRKGREGLLSLLSAPYLPENFLSPQVLPVLGIRAAAYMNIEKLDLIRSFFSAETQEFMGLSLSPWEAFGLRLASAWLFATASSAWEEIVFRGIALEREGMAFSILSFGLHGLPSLILPEASLEKTALGALSSLAFGFYAADLTKNSGYRLEKAIALNFWTSMISTVLNYLIDPDSDPGFDVSLRFAF